MTRGSELLKSEIDLFQGSTPFLALAKVDASVGCGGDGEGCQFLHEIQFLDFGKAITKATIRKKHNEIVC